ncbi:MAG TPA: hypothetical protein VH700_08235 [Gemmatimonadales bacterium]|jgi:hypothetical protein
MSAPARFLALTIAFALAGCSGGSRDSTGPDLPEPPAPGPQPQPQPPTQDPGPPAPAPQPGVQGSYLLERINQSQPGQLVTIANPDGLVIGLYRFEATAMSMDPLQTFAFSLSYTDDKSQFSIDDAGEFKQAGPISQDGALPLTFYSDVYGDQFTGVVLNGIVAIKYDFDGDGQLDTSFGFRRVE